MASTKEWTVDMLADLPDDGIRYEVIDGELFMTPAPTGIHQRAVGRLHWLLLPYADLADLDLLTAPYAVTFSNRREVQPDLLVMPKIGNRYATTFRDVGELILAVEVLSKHTARVDRIRKRDLYQDERVPEYWIVNTDTRSIERWRPDSTEPEILSTTITWQPKPDRDGIVIDLVLYFRAVFGQ